jgi:capsular polysaccharide transport system permease protein
MLLDSEMRGRLHPKLIILRALVMRDLMMRYGRGNIGFVWVVLEPMLLCVGVMVIWSLMGGSKGGYKVIEVVLTGYMPLTLWRHLTNGTIGLFRTSASLLYHRRVSLLDIMVGRYVLEFIGTTAALLLIWLVLYAADALEFPPRLDLIFLGWLMMGLIAAISGIGFAVVTERSEAAERFIQPLQYLNVPLSGCFFMVQWLPTWAQKLVLWHPHVHAYEVFRAGYFGDTVVAHYDLFYFFSFCLVLAFVMILLFRGVREKLQIT